MKDQSSKVLRVVAILFMGLTGALNILGGIGTSCAAFLTKDYPPYWILIQSDLQWLWQSFVVLTTLIGIANVWSTIRLSRGKDNAYRNAVIILVLGTLVTGVHVYSSYAVLEGIMPVLFVFLANGITLLLFLFLRLPGIRERVDFGRSAEDGVGQTAAGLTAIIVGLVVLTTSLWVGSSHVYEGVNWTHVLTEFLIGSSLVFMGTGVATLFLPQLKGFFVRVFATTR